MELKPVIVEAVARVCRRCAGTERKGELGAVLAEEVSRYSILDLQVIGGRLRNEVDRLPSPYREAIRPYFMDQLFGAHHELLLMHRTGAFGRLNARITDLDRCRAYWAMVPAGCFEPDHRHERHAHLYEPRHRLFYYLLAGFSMFVLDRPGHPVGTPFPGGFRVEARRNRYLCPVRDREGDLPYSICNYCPAEPSGVG
ncbi:MAG TPA: DUF2115 domain-containing protein [Methanoregulaceae archaeon]|nr:DUF2115 domain-containing protein [Methanoregulaceae archaeon]HQJ87398.1 DUF2115 domain-containing protein [Methanoregulaceae archaeon]